MALRTIRSGVTNHPEKSVLQFITDLVRRGGVISGFTCSEKAGGADMSVNVTPGTLYAKAGADCYPVSLDTITNVAVSLNSNANPLVGVIICYINLNVQPDPEGEGSDVAQFAYIAGLPASNPVPPTDDEIRDAIGTNSPFERICHVLVGSQVTTIVNEDLTDARRRAFVKSPRPAIIQSASGAISIDADEGNDFIFTLAGDASVTEPTNMLVGDVVSIAFIQDTIGEHTATWFAEVTPVGDILELASDPGQCSQYVLKKVADGKYYLFLAGKME